MAKKSFRLLKANDHGDYIQGFAPSRIESVTSPNALDTTNVIAVRCNAAVPYTYNGAGDTATIPAGEVTWIPDGLTALTLDDGVTVHVFEVME